MKLLIAGDFFISNNFRNISLIDSSITQLFLNSDYKIVNLETPLTSAGAEHKIVKTGPHLCSSERTMLPYLKKLKIDMVTLANNHILDYGAKGLKNTIDALKSCQINYVGAGMNLKDAAAPFSIDCDGIRIAILNFTENEWSIAEENKPGANPLNIIDNLNYIKAARAVHDKVICIIHGGHEFYNLPSPRMLKQYHFYAEQGADAIVGHHTHCIGGFEIYKNVPIIYSLGNFLFTLTSKNEEWYTGLLAELTINKENSIKFKLLPIRQRKENFEVYLLKEEKSAAVMRQIKEINKTILNRDNLQES